METALVRRTLPDAAAPVSAVAATAGGCAACFLSSGFIFVLRVCSAVCTIHPGVSTLRLQKYIVGWLQYDVGKIWEACRQRNECNENKEEARPTHIIIRIFLVQLFQLQKQGCLRHE
jgi:hypothetical protein